MPTKKKKHSKSQLILRTFWCLFLILPFFYQQISYAQDNHPICGLGAEGPCEAPELSTLEQNLPITYIQEMGLWNQGFQEPCPGAVLNQNDWDHTWKWVNSHIESQRVREISRWAVNEMSEYEFGPVSLVGSYQVLGCQDNLMLIESQLSVLPTHHPRVTRFLKLFVITDLNQPLLQSKLIVTIIGELDE